MYTGAEPAPAQQNVDLVVDRRGVERRLVEQHDRGTAFGQPVEQHRAPLLPGPQHVCVDQDLVATPR